MRTRAPSLPPQERKAHLTQAALRVLRAKGSLATTREIADEAGVAEGTIFRVFASKDELVEEALREAFDPTPLIVALGEIDPALPLRERLVAATTLVQDRFIEVFGLMEAVGILHPPKHDEDHPQHNNGALVIAQLVRLVEPDADRLTVTPQHLVHLLRLLTFSGSHHGITDGDVLSPPDIVDVLLDGTRKDR